MQVLLQIAIANNSLCDDVMTLLGKMSIDRSFSQASIAIEALTAAASCWCNADHGTALTMLFYAR